MAVEDVLKLKVRQCIKDLESLAKIISSSEENKNTYSDISQLVGEIINQLSVEFPKISRTNCFSPFEGKTILKN